MRRFLIDLLKWTVLAAAVYVVLLVVAGSVSRAGQGRNLQYIRGSDEMLLHRVRDIDTSARYDVLVIGSSHAYRGFDPRIFQRHGLRMFNLGSGAQTPAQARVLLHHHLHRIRPRLVLMEMYPHAFAQSGIEPALDVISNDRVDLATVRMALGTRHVTVLNTLVYALFRQVLGGGDMDAGPLVRANGDRYISGGYVQRGDTTYRPGRTTPYTAWEPLPAQQRHFAANVAAVRAAGADVVLVHTPVMPGNRLIGPAHDAFTAYCTAIAPYYDMSDLFAPGDTALFYDGHHLTQRGVERFNTELVRRLGADGHLAR
ncbi:MAG: hypothetical protein RBT71_07725 [Flavobacteriales bacterium]|jgi:hypothetical protein|nr:hypothetical protein [Flavobacteriales bacterium]